MKKVWDLDRAAAAFVAEPERALPQMVAEKVKEAFIDTAACVVAGKEMPVVQVALEFAQARYRKEETCSVFFGTQHAHPVAAAMVNAVAGHALDFDDFAFAAHPSIILVPTIWAEFERTTHRCGDLRHAYSVGYELWSRLTQRLPGSIHDRGWHPTSVLGTVCATASLCAIRGYDEERCRHALGLAAAFAAGLVASFGSMGKSLQVGLAVSHAFSAADLAAAGATGARNGLAALLKAVSGSAPEPELGPWSTDELALTYVPPRIKKYPSCYATHRIIDALLDQQKKSPIDAGRVTSIRAEVSATTLEVMKHHDPRDETQARFSLEFVIACCLLRSRVTLGDFSEEMLSDARVRHLMKLVSVDVVDERCPLEPAFALHDRVEILTTDGRYDSRRPRLVP